LNAPRLTGEEQRMLAGEGGGAARIAMRLLLRMAEIQGATRLLPVTRAHVDGCLYHGPVGVDFVERLVAAGGTVAVPTTLNVSSLDLLHPALYRGDAASAHAARRQMDAYVALGCTPTWTCAPYQLPERPLFGEQIAWAESNAIVFANSVLGARTERYGDFIDICAALTGRVPDAGLHRADNRAGEVLFLLDDVSHALLAEDVLYPVLGAFVGARTGTRVPVIAGLPAGTSEDRLKALGAAAASTGAVALFHAVGVTPEAPTLDAALHGRAPLRTVKVTAAGLRAAAASLSTVSDGRLTAVSLGTPHASLHEFDRVLQLLAGRRVHPDVDFYISTGRHTAAALVEAGLGTPLEEAGVQVVVDTCTYITPVLRNRTGVAMTDSAKWAYYAPGNIGVEVVFGSMRECVTSAVEGRIWRDPALWDGAGGSEGHT
jgi:predicted aconitase